MTAPEKATEIKAWIAAIIAFMTAMWGWVGWVAALWVSCMLMDYISGTAAAKKSHTWKSEIARDGLWHKLGEIFAVLVAALCDLALTVIISGSGMKLPFDVGPLVTPVVLLWYILTELGSIAENANKLGAPVPGWLTKGLEKYKDKLDDQQSDKEDDYSGRHEKPPDKTDMDKPDM